jgi:hypothetical protein
MVAPSGSDVEEERSDSAAGVARSHHGLLSGALAHELTVSPELLNVRRRDHAGGLHLRIGVITLRAEMLSRHAPKGRGE